MQKQLIEKLVNEALSQAVDLANNFSGEELRTELGKLVQSLSVEASGTTTVLYAGYVNGVHTSKITSQLAKLDDIRIIDKTIAAQVMIDDDFKAAVAKSVNLSIKEYTNLDWNSPKGKINSEFLFDGKDGLFFRGDYNFFLDDYQECDVDIWHDPNLVRSLFLSDKLVNALFEAGIKQTELALVRCGINQ